jgi:electron transfer flavoprotein alpha subunit
MKLWVFAEEIEGSPAQIALEMLTKARDLSDDVAAVYLGAGSDEAFATLGAHGASTVYHLVPGDTLPAAPAAAALAGLIEEHGPDLLLFGLTATDRDVAGRLSARIDKAVLSNAVDIVAEGDGVTVVNEILGGTTLVDGTFTGEGPYLVVVRAKAFAAEPADEATPEVVTVGLPDAGHAGSGTILESHAEETGTGPKLDEASVVIAGGRGMGTEEKFGSLLGLAELLGAAVGGTRAVVDAGWLPYSTQIGQTGTTVRPDVYLAFGVSGAMQHLVGMKDSGTIIAVNKDEQAPIFAVADLGIIGDVHQVVPKLIEALQEGG